MKEELLNYHKESWEAVKEFIPNELTPPYLEIGSPRTAWLNLDNSLEMEQHEPSESELLDVPKNMALIYPGKTVPINFAYGGILIPEKCLEDKIEQTKGALTHEQVHDALQSNSFIYGLSFIFSNQPPIHQVFNNFIEFMAHAYAARVMEKQGMPAEEYYAIPVNYTRKARESFGLENEMTYEDEVKHIIKQHEDFYKDIQGIDPIKGSFDCFGKFILAYMPKPLHKISVLAFTQLLKTPKMIRRRGEDNKWSTIEPSLNI